MNDETVSEITSKIQLTPEREAEFYELFQHYQPASGISYIDRPNGLTQEEQAIIQDRLKLKALSSS